MRFKKFRKSFSSNVARWISKKQCRNPDKKSFLIVNLWVAYTILKQLCEERLSHWVYRNLMKKVVIDQKLVN